MPADRQEEVVVIYKSRGLQTLAGNRQQQAGSQTEKQAKKPKAAKAKEEGTLLCPPTPKAMLT